MGPASLVSGAQRQDLPVSGEAGGVLVDHADFRFYLDKFERAARLACGLDEHYLPYLGVVVVDMQLWSRTSLLQ